MSHCSATPPIETDSDTDEEPTDTEKETFAREMDILSQKEANFFESLGRNPSFGQFESHLHPSVHEWLRPIREKYHLSHFAELVDQDTLNRIQACGIGIEQDYRHTAHGESHWDDQELQFLFNHAAYWVDMHNMGRDDHMNAVCWVASKIINFELYPPFLSNAFN